MIPVLRNSCPSYQSNRYNVIQSLCFLNLNFKTLAFCDCKAWFVSDLVGNSEDRFSHALAHFVQNIDFLVVFQQCISANVGLFLYRNIPVMSST